jgi:hypothetical protein
MSKEQDKDQSLEEILYPTEDARSNTIVTFDPSYPPETPKEICKNCRIDLGQLNNE